MQQIEGRNPVLELLRHRPLDIRRVIILKTHEKDPKLNEIVNLCKEHHVEIEKIDRRALDEASETSRHQGVIAIVKPPEYIPLKNILARKKDNLCVILLHEIQDPQNLGAILRTAEAAQVDVVIIPKRGSVGLTPTVHRVSMGGSIFVPVSRENIFLALKMLSEEGVRTIAVDSRGQQDYFKARLTGSVAFLLGGEQKGINTSLLNRCDEVLRIPMKGKISSLNVSAALAVILYEKIRQNSY